MPTPTILFYSPSPQPYGPKLLQLCAIQNIKLRVLDGTGLDRPLSVLAQGLRPGEPLPEGAPLPEPLLVLCHFSEKALDRLLLSLRRLPAPCLKAVLTPTNAGWTLRKLYGELVEERSQLGGAHLPKG